MTNQIIIRTHSVANRLSAVIPGKWTWIPKLRQWRHESGLMVQRRVPMDENDQTVYYIRTDNNEVIL